MRFLVVGEFDSDNVGDQLIGAGHESLFKHVGCAPVIKSLESTRTRSRENSKRYLKSSSRFSLHRLLYKKSIVYRHLVELSISLIRWKEYELHAEASLKDCDSLIIGGGQLLSDGTLRMLFRIYHITSIAKRRAIPVAAFGTGVSIGRTVISRYLQKKVLSSLSVQSYFRDAHSIHYARSVMSGVQIHNDPTPDNAIFAAFPHNGLKSNRRCVGVAPMSPSILIQFGISPDTIEPWWLAIIADLIARGEQPFLFSSGVIADHVYAEKLQSTLSKKGFFVDLLPRPETHLDLLIQLSTMRYVVAQRLHISIAYYAMGGIPLSAKWDKKVEEFYAMIGLQNRLVQIGRDSAALVLDKLAACDTPSVLPDQLVAVSIRDANRVLDGLYQGLAKKVVSS